MLSNKISDFLIEDVVVKEFSAQKERSTIGVCHIDFMAILAQHFAPGTKPLKSTLQKEYSIISPRFREWNEMRNTPSLSKAEQIFDGEGLDMALALEPLYVKNSPVENSYDDLIKIDMREVNRVLFEKGLQDTLEKNESYLLRQFCYIYMTFTDIIDGILDKREELKKRVSTAVIISKKTNWNLGSINRVLVTREQKSISFEIIERFSEFVLEPIGFVIRLVPVNPSNLKGYRFTPYEKINKEKRALISFTSLKVPTIE